MSNTLTFLGTGTSSGVPVIGCTCATCRSDDPHDKRFRTSAYVVSQHGARLLIDVGTDFRLQALQHQIHWLDGILLTHGHHDHIGGIDDLRQLNFLMQRSINLYGNALALAEVRTRFDYIFKHTQKGGGKPQLELHEINAPTPLSVNGQTIVPLAVLHGELPILGFQFDGLSYITDASALPPATMQALQHTDVLVLNALRLLPHSTHFSLAEALAIIRDLQPRRAYLIHLTHDLKHADIAHTLPPNVFLAHDNLTIEF